MIQEEKKKVLEDIRTIWLAREHHAQLHRQAMYVAQRRC
jgi:hypothetical protein